MPRPTRRIGKCKQNIVAATATIGCRRAKLDHFTSANPILLSDLLKFLVSRPSMHNLVYNSQRFIIGHSIDKRDKTKTIDTSLVHIMSHRKFSITVTKRCFSFLKLQSRVLPRSADVRLVSRTSSDNIIRCRRRNNTTMANQRLSSKLLSSLKP